MSSAHYQSVQTAFDAIFSEARSISKFEAQRLSLPDIEEVAPLDIQSKVVELQDDNNEWDDISVDVFESDQFVEILKDLQTKPAEAAQELQMLLADKWEARAINLLAG